MNTTTTTTLDEPTAPAGVLAPGAVFLGRHTPGSEAWEQARAGLCVTGTEIAAVLGLSPWLSPFTLWHRKAGLPADAFVPTAAAEWGVRLEGAVAGKFTEMHPELTVHETGTWRSTERPWQRATPDRLAVSEDGQLRLLEVKTSPYAEGWGLSGSDEIPVHYRCQVMWQLDTLGAGACHVAVLIGGFDYREYRIAFDQTDAELLRGQAESFLHTVRTGQRPGIDDSTSTYRTVKAACEGQDPVDVEIPPGLATRYRTALADAKTADAAKLQATSEILDHIATGRRATSEGRPVATRVVRGGRTHCLQPARTTIKKEAA